jgi:hypothetical protein
MNTTTPIAGAIGIGIFGSAYLALSGHSGHAADSAYAIIAAGFATASLLSSLAAFCSIRRIATAEELTAAA